MSVANNNSSASSCTLFDDQKQCDVVITVKRVFASLSLFGCVLMLFVIFIYRRSTSFVQRIILYMTISTLLSAIAYVMGDTQPDSAFCSFQGFLTNFADWTVLMWMLMITITLYLALIKEKRLDQKEWMFHFLCWGIPLVVSCLPFINNQFGPAGAWCWVKDTYWRFGIWFIPLFALLGVIITLYAKLVYTIRQRIKNFSGLYSHDAEQSQRILLDEIRQLRAYPFIYLLLNIIPLANRIQNAVSHNTVFWLMLLHVICASSLGLVNCIVFGLNRQTMTDLRWDNFKIQAKNRFHNSSIINEYEAQDDTSEITTPHDAGHSDLRQEQQ